MKRFIISLLSALGEAAVFEALDILIMKESFDVLEYVISSVVFFVINIIFYKWMFKRG